MRDCTRGYTAEQVTHTILRRMPDYVDYITPQFSRTHINFQRVSLVDTSNPFIARDIPTPDESVAVIRFRDARNQNFPYMLQMIHGSFMSRPNTLVAPGGKMGLAMEVILTPIIREMMDKKKRVTLGM
jgi:phosphoribulokinase